MLNIYHLQDVYLSILIEIPHYQLPTQTKFCCCCCIHYSLQRQPAEISYTNSICHSNSESLSSPQNVTWNGDVAGKLIWCYLANYSTLFLMKNKTSCLILYYISFSVPFSLLGKIVYYKVLKNYNYQNSVL